MLVALAINTMGEYRTYLGGEHIGIPKDDLLPLLRLVVEGILDLAKQVHYSHSQGFPDSGGKQLRLHMEDYAEQLAFFQPYIEDKELGKTVGALTLQLQELVDNDDRLTGLVAKSIDLPMPQTRDKRAKFKKKLDNRLKKNVGSFWREIYPDEFGALQNESERISNGIGQAGHRIIQRIDNLGNSWNTV